MTNPITFDEFLPAFFGIFSQKSFRGNDFLNYLHRADEQRSGDESSIVDTAMQA
jgi:hypothetical protein